MNDRNSTATKRRPEPFDAVRAAAENERLSQALFDKLEQLTDGEDGWRVKLEELQRPGRRRSGPQRQ